MSDWTDFLPYFATRPQLRRVKTQWARRDLYDLRVSLLPAAMDTPPTITKGVQGANSTIYAGATTNTASIQPSDARLTYAHGTVRNRTAAPTNFVEGNTIQMDASTVYSNFFSVRFMTDANEFEFVMRELGQRATIWVDGRPIALGAHPITAFGNDLSTYWKASFGANVLTYQCEVVSPASGGSGYVRGDLITLAGGTATTPAVVLVTQVGGGGAIGSARLVTPGAYSAIPSTPTSQASTTGSGTGATFTTYWGQRHTTRKMRRIEIFIGAGGAFGGLVMAPGSTVLPWPVSQPERWLFVGDSYEDGSYTQDITGAWGSVAAQALGVFDNYIPYGVSAIGRSYKYLTRYNFVEMVPRIIEHRPTRLVVGLGINDIGNGVSTSAVQAANTAAYTALMADLPDCLFFDIAQWQPHYTAADQAAYAAAIKAGFEAAVPPHRGQFIDAVAERWQVPDGSKAGDAPGTGNSGLYQSSDGIHRGSAGQMHLGYCAANGLVRAAQAILAAA